MTTSEVGSEPANVAPWTSTGPVKGLGHFLGRVGRALLLESDLYKEVAAARIRIFKIGTQTRISDVAEIQYIEDCEKRAIADAPIASAKARKLAAMREAAQPSW